MKHTTTEIYLISDMLAIVHKTIRTISFEAYAKAKYGLLLKVRYTAMKLVVTETVQSLHRHHRQQVVLHQQ